MPRNDKVLYPKRVTVPMNETMYRQISGLAKADGERPRGTWIRLQLQELLAKLTEAKK
jgi:hypothetical protein